MIASNFTCCVVSIFTCTIAVLPLYITVTERFIGIKFRTYSVLADLYPSDRHSMLHKVLNNVR